MSSALQLSLYPPSNTSKLLVLQTASVPPSSRPSGEAQHSTFGPSPMTCLSQDINGTGTPFKTDVVLTSDNIISIRGQPRLAHWWLSNQIPLGVSLAYL